MTALLGPRQCGKTTLARRLGEARSTTYFDLESQPDRWRLRNSDLMLGSLKGLVVLDGVQAMPELFSVLRDLADRRGNKARFLILGSASPGIIKGASETLAGRVEFVELAGFDLREASSGEQERLWLRGGFSRSFLSAADEDEHGLARGLYQNLSRTGHLQTGHHDSLFGHATVLDRAGPITTANTRTDLNLDLPWGYPTKPSDPISTS